MMNNQRTCSHCGDTYTHTPVMFGGIDMLAHCNTCDDCSHKLEKEYEEKARIEAAKERWRSAIPDEYRLTNPNHEDFPKGIFRIGEEFLKTHAKPFFGMVSESGKGKSRVSAMLAKKLIWAGEHVTWVNSAALQAAAQNQFDDERAGISKNSIDAWKRTRNLVLDDLGNLKASDAIVSTLYAIIEERTTMHRRTIWTSNETLEKMLQGDRLSHEARSRIISRIGGYSEIVTF
jgi:DNA replication protein DnaC